MLIKGPVFQVAFKYSAGFASMDMSGNRIYLGFPRNQIFALQMHLLCKWLVMQIYLKDLRK